ncbi:MAG: Lipoteichoic acid synthase 2 [Verrucomicrobiota bacterium]|jgi:hypothetical protein
MLQRLQRLTPLFAHRYGGLLLFGGIFLLVSLLIRMILAAPYLGGVPAGSLAAAFAWGSLYDLAMAVFWATPLAAALAFCPQSLFRRRFARAGWILWLFAATWSFFFGLCAELLFWDEFGVRFNFIAVDYLVYTTEVIANIHQSYNLPLIFGGISLSSAALLVFLHRLGWLAAWLDSSTPLRPRLLAGGGCLSLPLLALLVFYQLGRADLDRMDSPQASSRGEKLAAGFRHMSFLQVQLGNPTATELARNGGWSLIAAFWANRLEYWRWYPQLGRAAASTAPASDEAPLAACRILRPLLLQDNSRYLSSEPLDLRRAITGKGPEKRWNVIQITVESLSGESLGFLGDKKRLTPNLDLLASEGISFHACYATGTRTVRGMEALSLSVPPSPGQAVPRRPGNERLFTLPGLFRQRGYDSVFVYGGDGFFDNMSYYFMHNGCRIVDHPAKEREGVKAVFANAWGASDEDSFAWSMAEADKAHAAGRPFYHFVMSTSNHRPFTWPAGRIPAALKGVAGGAAYSDYAIGKFLQDAKSKAWFRNTVFVIVSDHCMRVAGKRELEVKKYHIPMLIWNPLLIKPQRIDTLCSQIDLAPTLLGLMDWSYHSRFFGRDLLRPDAAGRDRSFISNYQKLGYLDPRRLAVLKPIRQAQSYDLNRHSGDLVPTAAQTAFEDEATAYYEAASYLLAHGLYGELPENSAAAAAP